MTFAGDSRGGVARALPILLCTVIAACGDGDRSDGEGAAPVVRDSAGVTIVEHPPDGWTGAPRWRMPAEPELSIGVTEGAEEYQLFRVRGALQLGDGMIVVADGGSSELRFYDASGAHVRSAGGSGEGPGEFRVITALHRFGPDSLMVWDAPLRRGTIIGNDGGFGRTFPGPSHGDGFYSIVGVFAGGSVVGAVAGGITADTASTGVTPIAEEHFRFSPSSESETRSMGEFVTGETYVDMMEGMQVMSRPFAAQAIRTVRGDHLYYGSGADFTVEVYDRAGDIVRVVRVERDLPPLNEAVIDEFVDDRLAALPTSANRRDTEALYDRVPYPAVLPAYETLQVDGRGRIWVGDYLPPEASERDWTIFDAEGAMVGRISIPVDLSILDVDGSHILGSMTDSLGVERIVRFPLPG